MSGSLILQTINFGDQDWAEKINSNFEIINNHDHTDFDQGADLDFEFVSVVTDIFGVKPFYFYGNFINFVDIDYDVIVKRALYIKNSELFYTSGTKYPVQITINGVVNTSVVGGGGFIGLTNGAKVEYASIPDRYSFFGNTPTYADLLVRDIKIGQSITFNPNTNCNEFYCYFVIFDITPLPANGKYLLFEGATYTPAFILKSLTDIATTPTEAQQNIAQYNTLPAVIERPYITNVFCNSFIKTFRHIDANPEDQYYSITFRGYNRFFLYTNNEFSMGLPAEKTRQPGDYLVTSLYDRAYSLPITVSLPFQSRKLTFTLPTKFNDKFLKPFTIMRIKTVL